MFTRHFLVLTVTVIGLLATGLAESTNANLVYQRVPDYPACGGHTVRPLGCSAKDTCIDDPRNPNSCGMACDIPGICVPKNAQSCNGPNDSACLEGLQCYSIREGQCDQFNHNSGCRGICLRPKRAF